MHNYKPTIRPCKLAIICDGPTSDDAREGKPLSSGSGRFLRAIMASFSTPVESCFIGYVSTKSSWFPQDPHSVQVLEASGQLMRDLEAFQPNCCLLLGETAARVFGVTHSIYNYRGSLFKSAKFKCKAVPTYTPGEVMRNYSWSIPFKFDIFQAIQESRSPQYAPTRRQLQTWPTFKATVNNLERILREKPRIAFDLEGHPNQVGVTCYSIATSPNDAFIVPFRQMDNAPYWTLDEECEIWRLTAAVLSDPNIPKIAQNGLYELFVFLFRHKIVIRGLEDDTMYQMWELFHEQPKGLDFICSVYSREPYYKDERTVPDLQTHHEYCCKDSAVTFEACERMESELAKLPTSQQHYRFNIKVMKPYVYMQTRGCKIDRQRVAELQARTWALIQRQQHIVNDATGMNFNVKSHVQKKAFLYDVLGLPPQYKNERGKKKLTADEKALSKLYQRSQNPVLIEIIKLVRLRTRFSDIGKLITFPDGRIRCNYNPVGTDTGRLASSSTNVEAIINKIRIQHHKDFIRLQPKQEVDYLGTNLQNVTKDLRTCFIPDNESMQFFQYDLSGADAWTVAADLAALGNDKMLEHLRHGVKPSVVILLLNKFGNEVYSWPLEKLKAEHDKLLKLLKSPDCPPHMALAYITSKRCQHGTNYGMGPDLMLDILLKDTVSGWVDAANQGDVGTLELQIPAKHVVAGYQKAYSDYYGLEARTEWLKREIVNKGEIACASGAVRRITNLRSRKVIPKEVLRTAASHEPQANTTYATNLALVNMFYDPANRQSNGRLRVEPLLMIHDALAGQADKENEALYTQLMGKWFNIEMTIHGIPITIPVEGGWGPNWKATD